MKAVDAFGTICGAWYGQKVSVSRQFNIRQAEECSFIDFRVTKASFKAIPWPSMTACTLTFGSGMINVSLRV